MNKQLTDSRLANLGARAICSALAYYQSQFMTITQRAKIHFEQQEWVAGQRDAASRLNLYKEVVNGCVAEIQALLEERVNDKLLWTGIKAVYSGAIADREDWELAETFFNSITRRIFTTVGLDPQIEFVDTDFETPPTESNQLIYRTYTCTSVDETSLINLIENILGDYPFRVNYSNKTYSVKMAAKSIKAIICNQYMNQPIDNIEMIKSVFYRNKGAYLIGRININQRVIPLVFALLNNGSGIFIDTVLLDEGEVSVLFSFTRSYFLVEVARSYDLVRFLRSIMPKKRVAELYISIGHNKHGKTLLYRELLQTLAGTDEQFHIAKGQPGMVMTVFTMPSYEVVFKIIKDYFAPPKNISRQQVKAHYQMVFQHDRAGRLIDAQEFEHLKIERCRFDQELLNELKQVATKTVEIGLNYVVIKHAYVERRVVPLNLFIYEAEEATAQAAVIDLGYAIKDLAATNIFPGDMFLKNFGVTRHGRIVFYDYDELVPLTSCNFRSIPPPSSYNEELWDAPWYTIAENDIFPEEFLHFLGLKGSLREVFVDHHADLLQANFWQETQSRIRQGEVLDIFPYDQNKRFLTSKDCAVGKAGVRGIN